MSLKSGFLVLHSRRRLPIPSLVNLNVWRRGRSRLALMLLELSARQDGVNAWMLIGIGSAIRPIVSDLMLEVITLLTQNRHYHTTSHRVFHAWSKLLRKHTLRTLLTSVCQRVVISKIICCFCSGSRRWRVGGFICSTRWCKHWRAFWHQQWCGRTME